MFPSLGGYVIHGNSVGTLQRCLDSLQASCDVVVAIDSESTDGSAELCQRQGIQSIRMPWQGYGAARARAKQVLQDFDYIFFLDADEWLEPASIQALAHWRTTHPQLPCYTLARRDWIGTGAQRFVLRTERRKRIIQPRFASWSPSMIVHEALPSMPSASSHAYIEHLLCTEVGQLTSTLQRYALLWAIRFSERRYPYVFHTWLAPWRQALALGKALCRGALWQGGQRAIAATLALSHYHQLKYVYHKALQGGACAPVLRAYRQADYQGVFARLPQALAELQQIHPGDIPS